MAVYTCLKNIFCGSCRLCASSEVKPDYKWTSSRPSEKSLDTLKGSLPRNTSFYSKELGQCSRPESTPLFFGLNNNSPKQMSIFSPSQQHLRRIPSLSDTDFTMPEMSHYSSVLSQHQVSALFLTFPPRLRLYPWTLLYSINRDGCSLNNLYSKLKTYDGNLLLLILDTRRTAFGAVLSPPNLKLNGKVYSGTPETFLFTFNPRLRKFTSSGENNFFIQCNSEGISIGGWRPAIWIDTNLEKGTSDACSTFDNSPLTDEHFVIRDFECWAIAEFETVDYKTQTSKSAPLYQMFPSSQLASKKPELELGGVRCGRRSKGYHPTYHLDKSADKSIFIVGEEEESEDVFSVDTSRDSSAMSSAGQPRHHSTPPDVALPARGWSTLYE